MKKLGRQIEDLGYEITGDIDHGECFCEEKMLYEFIGKLEKLKTLAFKYYEETRAELEAEH